MPVSVGGPQPEPGAERDILVDDETVVTPGDTSSCSTVRATTSTLLDLSTVEAYTYVNSDGEEEARTEEPYFTFYATGGTFVEPFTLWSADDGDPDTPSTSAATWTAPVDPETPEVQVLIVVRDRRGGMAWSQLDILVE
ncbi:MAG: hypothetical protein H6739_16230 [Alphaproteobacteria bacterium]|nr:hypothetical protein [Alphaproteobacteria bacterium]